MIFLLPTQLGRHFWPSWSLVNGVRVDYLAPTIYLTDVLIIFLFFLSFFRRGGFLTRPGHRAEGLVGRAAKRLSPTIIIVVLLAISILINNFSPLSLIKAIKIIEIFAFAWLVKTHLNKKNYPQFIFILSLSLLFQSGLAIAQFFNHGSLNGIFYWFGERNFSGSTPGIANASINGALILRSYGTFPHPNVLAGFLLVGIVPILSFLRKQESSHPGDSDSKSSKQDSSLHWNDKIKHIFSNGTIDPVRNKISNGVEQWNNRLSWFVIAISSFALFLTLSRVAILLWVIFLGLYVFNIFRRGSVHRRSSTIIILLIFVAVCILLQPRFLSIFGEDKQSYENRLSQSRIALTMFRDYPLTGVGLNQYLVQLPKYMKITSFKDYQPVHNVFLLILAETGLAGLIVILLYCYIALKKHARWKLPHSYWLIVICFVFACADHYFYTLQQGNLMMGLILGLTIVRLDR